eukprot:TRINITY_DN48078_c0_g2_i2.p1 TRINITY_DN48078_c0_g2~~TRINITY_DN48078_c0_g2_i2.p1  ORF type:complete len:362 (+),score=4.83 TRINITY_DN48078_c0_g2_i2:43-1128(+)
MALSEEDLNRIDRLMLYKYNVTTVIMEHIADLYLRSETRTPLVCLRNDGDPVVSITELAKLYNENGQILELMWDFRNTGQREKLEELWQLAIDNGDWLILSQSQCVPEDVLRDLAIKVMTLEPNPEKFPNRRKFRLWIVVHFPIAPPSPLTVESIPLPNLLVRQSLLSINGQVETITGKVPERGELPHLTHEGIRKGVEDPQDSETADPVVTGKWFHHSVLHHDSQRRDIEDEKNLWTFIDNHDLEPLDELLGRTCININVVVRPTGKEKIPLNPLAVAIRKDDIELVRLLLQNGANPNFRAHHSSPPPIFAGIQSVEVLQLLIEYKASVYSLEYQGNSLFTSPNTSLMIKKWLNHNAQNK